MIQSEEEAREWVGTAFDVSRETMERLDRFAKFLSEQNEHQNLVARSTLDQIWSRHIADSAQLLKFVPSPTASWLDLGSGAGFPGLIIAALHNGPITLVESRKLRVSFLEQAAELLQVRPRILPGRAERMEAEKYDVISARAFAELTRLLQIAHPFSTEMTRWILPKGKGAQTELEQVRSTWQGDFRLEPSLTDPDARIIIAQGVSSYRRNGS
jgi:16S rRNA (guanine527-N7)-methyltransferase